MGFDFGSETDGLPTGLSIFSSLIKVVSLL